MKGLLAGQGVRLEIEAGFLERLNAIQLWDGRPIAEGLKTRLEREYDGCSSCRDRFMSWKQGE